VHLNGCLRNPNPIHDKTTCHFSLIGSTILGMKAESRPDQDPKNTSTTSKAKAPKTARPSGRAQ